MYSWQTIFCRVIDLDLKSDSAITEYVLGPIIDALATIFKDKLVGLIETQLLGLLNRQLSYVNDFIEKNTNTLFEIGKELQKQDKLGTPLMTDRAKNILLPRINLKSIARRILCGSGICYVFGV